MKKKLRKVFYFLLVALVVIQFIRPGKNDSEKIQSHAMTAAFTVPDNVQHTLERACYDCHSNKTNYPWYYEVQPVRWWLASHVNKGKRSMNFDEFATYRLSRQYRKFHDIEEEIEDDDMPLSSYLWIHHDSKLSSDEKTALINWAREMQASMKAKYPADSLAKPKRQ